MAIEKATVSIRWNDYGGQPGNTSFLTVPDLVVGATIDTTDIEQVMTDLEALSNAKVCGYTITLNGMFSGKATATNGTFLDAAVGARLIYAAAGGCGSQERLTVPAPLSALFSGADLRVVNAGYANLATLNTHLIPLLTDKNGDTGLAYLSGARVSKPLPQIIIG